MEEGLFYSEEAKINRVLFLAEKNDIVVFVEDENKEYVYEEILERLFAYKIQITNIFPQNGKKGVIKAFRVYGSSYENKPAIYIVDGDFEYIMKKEMINHPSYIYLEKYNIESYLVDRSAILRYVASVLQKRKREVEAIIEYDSWYANTYEQYKELFINYIIAQHVCLKSANVGNSPYGYLDSEGRVDSNKIVAYKSEVKKQVANYDELYEEYSSRIVSMLHNDETRIVCGKYVLACLIQYLRKKTHKKFKEEELHRYLISEFDIKKLGFLKERINAIMECA